MCEITWTHPFLYEVLAYIPLETSTLIDVGCGKGIIGALMRMYRCPKRLVAIDAFKPYLDFCKKHNLYDEFLQFDLTNLPLPFNNMEFDVATCIEVIEHLPKKLGFKLLEELERIAKKVVVTTPSIFFAQKFYNNNPHQAHLSVWTSKEFSCRGYKVQIFGKIEAINIKYLYPSESFKAKIFARARTIIKKLFTVNEYIIATKP